MPTVHRAFGLRFVIFTNDHDPPHVHVFGPRAEARIGLGPLPLLWSKGFRASELRRIMAEVAEEQDRLMEAWDRIHD
jgi:hypothetical protein